MKDILHKNSHFGAANEIKYLALFGNKIQKLFYFFVVTKEPIEKNVFAEKDLFSKYLNSVLLMT